MRVPEDIRQEMRELDRQIQDLQNRRETLSKEYDQASKSTHKAKLFTALSGLGVQFQDSDWKPLGTNQRYSRWDPHARTYSRPIEEYNATTSHEGFYLNARLCLMSADKWLLHYSLGNYGTSSRRPRLFTGEREEAIAWAREEVNKKLLNIKKQLQKDIAKTNANA